MTPLLVGIGLGFTVAASFGPINVFSLSSGSVTASGRPTVSRSGPQQRTASTPSSAGSAPRRSSPGSAEGWFQILGGAVLIVLAVRMARPPSLEGERRASRGFVRSFAIALGATLANPITIVYWAGAFAGVVPRFDLSRAEALVLLPLGVVVGGVCWATLLAAGSASPAATWASASWPGSPWPRR